ncbi:hypothetical protein DPV78_001643 [Talaromyces pinophilus]|nr:hypothetical protein DPV78_001643 [Talaromyces pinophilus]
MVTPRKALFSAVRLSPVMSRVFRDAFWDGVSQTYFNPRSGWGDGDGALRSIIQASIDEVATYQQAPVSTLIIDQNMSCRGVRLEDGSELNADHVIVATGAWTPEFLADSAPENNNSLQVGGRMIAAGAIQCSATFPVDQAEKLKDAPVIFNAMAHTEDGSIPPRPDWKLKFNYERSFTNYETHQSGEKIRFPLSRTPLLLGIKMSRRG